VGRGGVGPGRGATLLGQGGSLESFVQQAQGAGFEHALLLGQDSVAPFVEQGCRVEQRFNPWLFARRPERLERAYARAQALLGEMERLPGFWPARWGLREGLLHELLYFLCEPWEAGLCEAELLAEQPELQHGAVWLAPRAGLQGRLCAARLGLPALPAPRAAAAPPPALRERLQGLRRGLDRLQPGPGSPPCDVLVVEAYANRLRNMGPVVEALRQRGQRCLLLSLARQPQEQRAVAEAAAQLEMPLLPWTRLLASLPYASLAARLAPLGAASPALLPGLLQRLRADGLGERQALALLPSLSAQMLRSAARMVSMRALFERLLQDCGARLVLTSRGDDTILRVLGRLGLDRGVPVVDIEHGKRIDAALPPIRDIVGVDFALSGAGSLSLYAAAGQAPERLHAVGSPAFDRLTAEAAQAPPLSLPQPYLVYSSNATRIHKRWDPDNPHSRLLRALDDYLATQPELHLAVKLHPQEYHGDTEAQVAQLACRTRIHVLRGTPNGPLFQGAEAQLSLGSTTTLEAMLLGRPAVFVDLFGQPTQFDFAVAQGGVQRVTRIEDLAAGLDRARHERPALAPLERYYAHRLDGGSAARILALPPLRSALPELAAPPREP